MSINDLFGLPLDQDTFDVDKHADLIGIKKLVENTRSVKKLRDENGPNHPIVQIAKRQTILKHLKQDLESCLLPYDQLFYRKEVNTAESVDRRYGAEEKLLEYALIVVCGKTLKRISQENYKPDTHALRETDASLRFTRYWSILGDHTREAISAYQADLKAAAQQNKENSDKKVDQSDDNQPGKKKEEGGFWSKLFS